jgi:hypothetical protein
MKRLSPIHRFVGILLLCVSWDRHSFGAEAPHKGQVIVESSFDTDAELAQWQRDKYFDVGIDGGRSLFIESKTATGGLNGG